MAGQQPSAPESPPFFNEMGVKSIEVGVAAFDCIGALPPHDHPRVYLNLGDQAGILCPYCSTEFRLNAALGGDQTNSGNCRADLA